MYRSNDGNEINREDNYDQLEKIVQKHEGEIRTHIRVDI